MKLVILDRDGVINEDSDRYIKSPDEWIPIPGSLEAIARFKQHGYQVAVVTNQSGIARGLYDEATLHAMHAKMQSLLREMDAQVDLVLHCPHGPNDSCDCRKPLPGMYRAVAEHYRLTLPLAPREQIYAVGDSLRDLQAAQAVGALPVLVRTGKGERTLAASADEVRQLQAPIFENLSVFADYLLADN